MKSRAREPKSPPSYPLTDSLVEVQRLLERVAALEAALAPFVAMGNVSEWGEQKVKSSRPDNSSAVLCVTLGDVRRARAVLAGLPHGQEQPQ